MTTWRTVACTIKEEDAVKLDAAVERVMAVLDDDQQAHPATPALLRGKYLTFGLKSGEMQPVPDGDKPITYTTAASR